MYLAEHVRFHADANARSFIPWIQSGPGGFVLSGFQWQDAEAAQYARTSEPACDYVVVTHLKTAVEPWVVEVRLLRTIDAKCLGTASTIFPSAQPDLAAKAIARDLLPLLARHAEVALTAPPANYQVPAGADFGWYLLRLEQLLAARCNAMDGAQKGFLSGEREIIDGNLHLCLGHAKNPATRILLLQTMKSLKRVWPELVAEYRDKLQRLQREHPLAEPAQGICDRLLNEVLAT